MRRLPVFLVLDVSDSMIGEPLRLLEQGLERFIRQLRQDPHALESVYLSVIVFAGRVETLVSLIDLVTFYPPRLPVGSGTALGAALQQLMGEIDQQVRQTTSEQKGDWKPLVYLMTDGKATDECQGVIKKWQDQYAGKAQLISIGMGAHADTHTLAQFSDEVLTYSSTEPADFSRFIEWITLSVRASSMRVDGQVDPSGQLATLLSKSPLAQSVDADWDFAIFVGRCQQHHTPYLLKYERRFDVSHFYDTDLPDTPQAANEQYYYQLSACLPLDESYFHWSTTGSELVTPLSLNRLQGSAPCPHCHRRFSLGLCGCGRIFCVNGSGLSQCPWCQQTVEMNLVDEDDDNDVSMIRSRG